MSPVIDQRIKIRLVFMIAVFIWFLMTASIGLAGESGKSNSVIRNITPLSEMGSHRSNANAADYFDLVGRLNGVEGNQVTIGDRQLTLAPGVGTHGMSQYNLVGAKLNGRGEVVALELISNEPN
jgi:hypothetical protein